MAETRNFEIPRGSSVVLQFSNKPPGPLPGSTVHFTIARNPNSKVKKVGPKTCSTPNGEGEYTCELSSQDTDIEPGKYFWDTRVVDPGSETLLGRGICVITPIAELPVP